MKDAAIRKLIRDEEKRQRETLNLIPSENIVSREVLAALGSPLTNKYSEGYPGRRYYAGHPVIDRVELLAQERARKAFALGARWHVNVQPYSGSPANMAVYYALLAPGETIMGLALPFGGHLTHGWSANFSARFYRSVQYGVGRDGLIDMKAVRRMARNERPKILVTGGTAYPRRIDFKGFSNIAREVGAYFFADVSHEAGLIAAGAYPSPFPYADVVTMTTHKTLRGPRGAIIFANGRSPLAARNTIDIGQAIDRAVFPALQGGPHDHQTAAIAVALYEAAAPAFRKYGKQIVKNAYALSRELVRLGFSLVTGGTDTHLMLIDLAGFGISGREAQDLLEANGIVVNRNAVPYDKRSPFDPSGIRIGTPALTTRGMKEKEMREVARLVFDILKENKNAQKRVRELCRKFPVPA